MNTDIVKLCKMAGNLECFISTLIKICEHNGVDRCRCPMRIFGGNIRIIVIMMREALDNADMRDYGAQPLAIMRSFANFIGGLDSKSYDIHDNCDELREKGGDLFLAYSQDALEEAAVYLCHLYCNIKRNVIDRYGHGFMERMQWRIPASLYRGRQ